MTTRMQFGADVTGAGGPFGLAWQMTHTSGQVAEALRGHFTPDDLAQLARLVDKAAKRQTRKHKDPGRLHALAQLLDRSSYPPAIDAPVQVFDQPTGGQPLQVVLSTGDWVTEVPAGASFTVPQYDGGQLFMRPVGSDGPDGLVLTGARAGAVVKITDDLAAGVAGVTVQVTDVAPADAD